jgi:hypothetical protein
VLIVGSGISGPCGGVASGGGRVSVGFEPGARVPVITGVWSITGTPDVPTGRVVGGGATSRAGMVSTCPSDRELGSAMLFARTIASTVTPKWDAMPDRVSPAWTAYVVAPTVGRGKGVEVGVGTGVINKRMRSPLLPFPPSHPIIGRITMIYNAMAVAKRRGAILPLTIFFDDTRIRHEGDDYGRDVRTCLRQGLGRRGRYGSRLKLRLARLRQVEELARLDYVI